MARYLVRKAPGVSGAPIPEDEPCLVIRAQDRLAVRMMLYYLAEYELLDDKDPAVLVELTSHLNRLITWQQVNPVKTADR